jgi:membrane associated rhomboid family serine protease
MLIIPLTGKISWRNPPVVTIGIILVNCLVYFILQSGDMKRLYQAEDYYFDSGLAEIEALLYMQHLKATGKDALSLDFPPRKDDETLAFYHHEIEEDIRFLEKLRKGQILTPDNPAYSEWKDLRETYEDKLSEVVYLQYGFRPAYRTTETFFTYMFLHGGFAHLFGNMVFLWLVGCALELGCGRLLYSAVYIVGGLLAVILYWLIYLKSTVPLVGASGAIAGLMGAFTIIFRKNKIKTFYSLGFYFNYLKAPAIILLPVWIGKELFSMFFGGVSHVAYVAHIGGLAGGAVLGFISMRYLGASGEEVFQEEPKDEVTPLLEEAQKYIGELDLEKGKQRLEQVLFKAPDNIHALTHLFNIEKLEPQTQRFHEIAKRLLSILCCDNHDPETAFNTYKEYTDHALQPRLSAELYLRISFVCSATAHFDRSKRILAMLMKKKPDLPGIPTALLKLANCYRQKGMQDLWQKCLQVIYSRYPHSGEAQIAMRALKD